MRLERVCMIGLAWVLSLALAGASPAQEPPTEVSACPISGSLVGEAEARPPEISTEELRTLLQTDGGVVLDTRPHLEWAISHIPGAFNVAPKPGMAMSEYTSDVAEIGAEQARAVADAIAGEAFHNVAYFEGKAATVLGLVSQ